MDKTELSINGAKGGRVRAKRLSAERRLEIAMKAVKTRWAAATAAQRAAVGRMLKEARARRQRERADAAA